MKMKSLILSTFILLGTLACSPSHQKETDPTDDTPTSDDSQEKDYKYLADVKFATISLMLKEYNVEMEYSDEAGREIRYKAGEGFYVVNRNNYNYSGNYFDSYFCSSEGKIFRVSPLGFLGIVDRCWEFDNACRYLKQYFQKRLDFSNYYLWEFVSGNDIGYVYKTNSSAIGKQISSFSGHDEDYFTYSDIYLTIFESNYSGIITATNNKGQYTQITFSYYDVALENFGYYQSYQNYDLYNGSWSEFLAIKISNNIPFPSDIYNTDTYTCYPTSLANDIDEIKENYAINFHRVSDGIYDNYINQLTAYGYAPIEDGKYIYKYSSDESQYEEYYDSDLDKNFVSYHVLSLEYQDDPEYVLGNSFIIRHQKQFFEA